jgi:hypothetical protein
VPDGRLLRHLCFRETGNVARCFSHYFMKGHALGDIVEASDVPAKELNCVVHACDFLVPWH